MEDDSEIPAPREYGCPVCLSGERLYFVSLDFGKKSEVKCERDEWRGKIRSIKYEQQFVRLANRKLRRNSILSIAIGIIIVSSVVILPQIFPPEPHITLKILSSPRNWTVTVNTILNAYQIMINEISVKILSKNNYTLLPETLLLNLSSGEYYMGINFTNRFPFDYLAINESFIVDKSRYSTGCKFLLIDENSILVYCNYDLKSW